MKIFSPILNTNKPDTYSKKTKLRNLLNAKKYKIALEISNVGLWEYNIKSNKVFFSKESLNIIGYKNEKHIQNTRFWNDKVHPEDVETYFRDFNLHLKGELDTYENEHRVLCKDGTYKWVLDKGKVVEKDNNGKPTLVIGTFTDITHRKTYETKIQENLMLITHQNKRLHNFTHIVSHNLKTHIGNLKNILEFYNEAETEKEKSELMSHLKTISDSLTTTIVDLDDIISIKSKANNQQLNERINLHNCAHNIIESLKLESANKNVKIFNALRTDDVLVTSRSYIESILHNLISNGIKYSDAKKTSQVLVQSINSKKELKLMVSDNGIGIDMERYKHKMFEMYQTFHGTNRKDSRGIGLYITKTQVEAINGSIEVESKLNEGTTFIITFKKQKAS